MGLENSFRQGERNKILEEITKKEKDNLITVIGANIFAVGIVTCAVYAIKYGSIVYEFIKNY